MKRDGTLAALPWNSISAFALHITVSKQGAIVQRLPGMFHPKLVTFDSVSPQYHPPKWYLF